MSFRVRPARNEDFQAIYEMAKLTGGGFTNRPRKGNLGRQLKRSEAAFAAGGQSEGPVRLRLENVETAKSAARQGFASRHDEPFILSQHDAQSSPELGKNFRAEMLTLTTISGQLGSAAYSPPGEPPRPRCPAGAKPLLFIKLHRTRFANQVLAELRGVIDEAGGSPFWDAIAGRFFGMNFQEADAFNGTHGTRFIADLMPKTPIYTALLPESARAIMAIPHPSGRAAMRMLEQEGFSGGDYIDIFDGGPTMSADTDDIRTIREAQALTLARVDDGEVGKRMMLAAGLRGAFASGYGHVNLMGDGEATLDSAAAALLGIAPGETFLAVGR